MWLAGVYLFQKKGTDLILDCRIYDVYQPSYVGSTKDKIVERIPRTKKIIYSNRDILGINDGKKGKDFKNETSDEPLRKWYQSYSQVINLVCIWFVISFGIDIDRCIRKSRGSMHHILNNM